MSKEGKQIKVELRDEFSNLIPDSGREVGYIEITVDGENVYNGSLEVLVLVISEAKASLEKKSHED